MLLHEASYKKKRKKKKLKVYKKTFGGLKYDECES